MQLKGWQQNDLMSHTQFVAVQRPTEGMDRGFFNGDAFVPNAWTLEPVYRAEMLAPMEA